MLNGFKHRPWPQKEFLHKEIPHDTLHLTEARAEGHCVVCEGLDEAGLVLLPIKTKDEGFLTRLNDLVCLVHQDTCKDSLLFKYHRNKKGQGFV